MSRFLVPISGKLIVTAKDEGAAKERANVYLADRGMAFIKAQNYGVEPVSDDSIVPVEERGA